MRGSLKFLVVCLGLLCAVASGLDLAAGCRCNKPAKGERKAARHERKAGRHASRAACVVPNGGGQSSYYNPYGGDAINQTWGAATPIKSRVETEVVWRCGPRGCYPVRVPVAAQAQPIPPQSDPQFSKVADPSQEETPQAGVFPPGVLPDSN